MENDLTPIISIIIPVYNVELYLKECIESVLNQSFKNFEIMLINDGSTDNSQSICLEYKNSYNNITLINQNNQGLSAARNNGIETAKGQYICFIDSDDIIHKDFLKILYEQMGDSEITICKEKKFYENEPISLINEQNITSEVLSGSQMNEYLYTKNSGSTIIAPNKLFNIKLWDNFRFPLGKLHEDCWTIYKVLDSAKKVKFFNNELYFYRQRTGSITQIKSFQSLKDEYDAASEQIKFFSEKKQFHIVRNANRFRKSLFLLSTLDKQWNTWKQYSIIDILKDDLRTKMKLKLIIRKLKK